MRTLITMVLMLLGFPLWSQPIQRNFFVTNINPRVVVAAGTNVTVQYTTTGTDIRTYTVNSSGGGGTQTNISYTAVTNAPWQWGTQNGTNWAQLDTNILSSLFTNSVVAAGTNIIVGTNGLVYTVNVDMGFTNYLASTNYAVTAATNAAYNSTNGFPWTNIYSTGISGGATNQVYTQVGWSGYPQVTNLSLVTNGIGTAIVPVLHITNGSPSSLGAQQASGALMFDGQGFRSGNSTTMPVSMGWYVLPVQGSTANPTAKMYPVISVSNAAPTQLNASCYIDSGGGIYANGIVSVNCGLSGNGLQITGPTVGGVGGWLQLLNNNTGLNGTGILFGNPNNNQVYPSITMDSTNPPTIGIRPGTNIVNYASLVASNVTATSYVTATNILATSSLQVTGTGTNYLGTTFATNFNAINGVLQNVKTSFSTNFTCTTNQQVYFCNGTNQLVTLPDASTCASVIYRICVTNGWAKVIITNATGTQTIRDGSSLSHTQIGIGNPAFISDGAHWWPASKIKNIMANAQFSCTTNIPLTSAAVAYPVTFNSTDFNNSQGIALLAGTNGLLSKMWITNSGQYEFSPSIVITFGGNNTVTTWFRSNGTNISNSATAIKGAAGGSIRCVTIPFLVTVTQPTAFEIWCLSSNTGDSLSIQAAGGSAPDDYPLSPSVICPVKKISDTWP